MARDGFDREAPRDEWREARKKPVVVEFRGPYRDTETVETIATVQLLPVFLLILMAVVGQPVFALLYCGFCDECRRDWSSW